MQDNMQDIFFIIILILVNAYFAASEIALISVRQVRVRQLADKGDKRAKRLNKLLDNPSHFLSTIQVGITLMGFLASAAAAVGLSSSLAELLKQVPLLAPFADPLALGIVTVITAGLTLLFGELIPKRIAMQRAEKIALFVVPQIDILALLASPVVKGLSFLTNIFVRLLGGSPEEDGNKLTEEELRLLLTEQENLLDEEKNMIESIFEFADTMAREVMIPRTDINAVKDTATLAEIVELADQTGNSRFPVYRETIDQIEGILAVKDIMKLLVQKKEKVELKEILLPAYFVPETKNVVELFQELKNRRLHMAMIVDEYGGIAGLVTIEDLVEEIMGDINDEHDPREDEIRMLNENQALVNGVINVEDLNEKLEIELPVTDYYETLGGFILDHLGRIPLVGEEIEYDRIKIKVETMQDNRIVLVRLTTAKVKNLLEE